MHLFLINNRDDLIARCKHKVAQRPRRAATMQQLEHGIPLFIDQLTRTLEAEALGQDAASNRISGAAGGDGHALSEIGVSAAAHGRELQQLGFTVDQVVHDYGDLCQAITDLAFERDAPFPPNEFRTLNRCLDNAIADAVTEFGRLREASLAIEYTAAANVRMGFFVHELRNALGTATLATSALELGNMTMAGATGAVLKRSLLILTALVDRSFSDVRKSAAVQQQVFSVAAFVADAQDTARLETAENRCIFSVEAVDPALGIRGDRGLLLGAVANLLQNAFKFTQAGTEVNLKAYASLHHVLIEVSDHCGGLPPGGADEMFTPFHQRSDDRSGLGLGLSIARQGIEADGGTLAVRDVPRVGCVFTICLPRHRI
jgi:signal transduction histidine kinase